MTPLNTRGRERDRVARKYGGSYPDVIFDLKRSGKTPDEIAGIFGIKESTVKYHLSKQGGVGTSRSVFKLSDDVIRGVFLFDGTIVQAAKEFNIAHSTAGDIKRVSTRYRPRLEQLGLVAKIEPPKSKKRPCLKCGKLFTRTDKNWAVCPGCDRLNKKKQ